MVKTKKYKIDIFEILNHLDLNDFSYYDNIEDKEELSKQLGFMLPLWMIGSNNDKNHRILIQDFDYLGNMYWNKVKNPVARYKILAAIGLGGKINHKFIHSCSSDDNSKILLLLKQTVPDVRKQDIILWIKTITEEDFINYVNGLGYQKEELKEFLSEFRKIKK